MGLSLFLFGNANGLGATESSLASRLPPTSIEGMLVPYARTGQDLCSHQAQKMYLGRNAPDVKAWAQIQNYVR